MPANREQQAKALAELCPIAIKYERLVGLPAQLTCGQIFAESDWLQRRSGEYNVLGMKRASRHKLFVVKETREVVGETQMLKFGSKAKRKRQRPDGSWDVWIDLEFADYASLDAAIADYAWLISRGAPYASAWAAFQEHRDWIKLASDVAKRYATDPGYAKLIIAVGSQSNVTEALLREKELA